MRLFFLSTSVLCMLLSLAPAASFATESLLLDANFDSHTPNTALGVGGPDAGEPVSIPASISATVIEAMPGSNHIQISRVSGTAATRMRFGLADGVEIDSGRVNISFDLTPSDRDGYSILVREAGSSASSFLNLTLFANGTLSASDQAGMIPNSFSYSANQPLHFEMRFDMDAGTSTLWINADQVYANHAHGITGTGLGSILFGYSSGVDAVFDLDALRVTHEPAAILDADFDSHAAAQPIAAQGAAFGEPIIIDPTLTTLVQQVPGTGNHILSVEGEAGGDHDAYLQWGFLDDIEISEGQLHIDLKLQPRAMDYLKLMIREKGGTNLNFSEITFTKSGSISSADAAGFIGAIGSYAANQVYQLHYEFDMDARTLSLWIDDVKVIDNRSFLVGSTGIGQILFGIPTISFYGSPFAVDDLLVTASVSTTLPSVATFLQQPVDTGTNTPMSTAIEIVASTPHDAPVPDGTLVELERVSGPASVTLSNATAMTTGGVAAFPLFSLDTTGSYVLRGKVGDIHTEDSVAFEVTTSAPDISIGKSMVPISGSTVVAGETVHAAIQVQIMDEPLSTDLVINDTLGSGLEYVSTTGTSAFSVDDSGNPLQFTLPTGTPAGYYAATYNARISEDASGTVTSTLQIIANGGDSVPSCDPCGSEYSVVSPMIFVSGFE